MTLPDVVVTATRTPQPIQRIGSAITVITAEEIERSATSPTRSVDDLFRRVPGVSLTQAGGPGQVQTVRIRGGDVRHTLVLIDGIRMNDPVSTGREFDFANLVLADIERIEVLRGPQSALYGSDAMGGVINIITRRGRGAPKASLAIEGGSFNTKEARGAVSGGNERVDFSVGFAGLDTDGFSAFGYRIPRLRYLAPGGFEKDGADRRGVTGRVGVNVTDDVRVEFGGGSNYNRAEYDAAFLPFPDTPSLATSRLHNGYGRLIADTFGGTLRNTVTTFANRTEREFRDVTFGLFGSTRTDRFHRRPRRRRISGRSVARVVRAAHLRGARRAREGGQLRRDLGAVRDAARAHDRGRADHPLGLRPAPGVARGAAAPVARRARRRRR